LNSEIQNSKSKIRNRREIYSYLAFKGINKEPSSKIQAPKSKLQIPKNKEQRTKNKEQRTKNKEQKKALHPPPMQRPVRPAGTSLHHSVTASQKSR
jgi:hypothetical protein